MQSVIQVPNRPRFPDIEQPEKPESQGPGENRGLRDQQDQIDAGNLVPDDT